jgi:hypothetical protein
MRVRTLLVQLYSPRSHRLGRRPLSALLETGRSPALAELDAARQRVSERLLAHDPNVILDLVFTEDPRCFAPLSPAR